ncbi:unnamed protein product [Bathycoccus prasinos]
MADFQFLLPDRLKSRLDHNQQHQRKSESFEHRLFLNGRCKKRRACPRLLGEGRRIPILRISFASN